MKILLIDAGNSRLKWASMNDDSASLSSADTNQQAVVYGNKTPIECYVDLIEKEGSNHYEQVLLVSVQGNEFVEQAKNITNNAGLDFFNVNSQAQFGSFKNGYTIPEQLGADRFVAMLAAHELYTVKKQSKPCIVIDCGTAVTIDAIDANGQHLGGLILPGLQVCSNSLLKNTQQLFTAQASDQKQTLNLLTDNTSDAIISGSFYGLSNAIKGTCLKIEEEIIPQPQDVIKIVCGGDARVLLPELPDDYLIYTDLVMQGLKLIAKQTETFTREKI